MQQDWIYCLQMRPHRAECGYRWLIISSVGEDGYSYIYSCLFIYFFLNNSIIITFAS